MSLLTLSKVKLNIFLPFNFSMKFTAYNLYIQKIVKNGKLFVICMPYLPLLKEGRLNALKYPVKLERMHCISYTIQVHKNYANLLEKI